MCLQALRRVLATRAEAAGRIQSTHVLKVYGHKLLNPGTKIWSCTWSKAFFAKKMAKRRLREKTDPRFLALARCVPTC